MSVHESQALKQLSNELRDQFGVLIRKSDLAKVLQISPANMQNTLRTSRDPRARYIAKIKKKFGRRVFFPTSGVAEALVLDEDELRLRLESD